MEIMATIFIAAGTIILNWAFNLTSEGADVGLLSSNANLWAYVLGGLGLFSFAGAFVMALLKIKADAKERAGRKAIEDERETREKERHQQDMERLDYLMARDELVNGYFSEEVKERQEKRQRERQNAKT